MLKTSFSLFNVANMAEGAGSVHKSAQQHCDRLSRAKPGDSHEVASQLMEVALKYYGDVRGQAQQSFFWALVLAGVGTAVFLATAVLVMYDQNAETVVLAGVGGALIHVVSGINFVLYGRAARQFASFHICLERFNRFLIANTICENVQDRDKKDDLRAELVVQMFTAPMLTLDNISGAVHATKATQRPKAKQDVATSSAKPC
jgi:hypothetical protein